MDDDNDKRNVYDLVLNAIQVQDAVNLGGVVYSFQRDIMRLRHLLHDLPNFSTEMVNRHPVCVMYSSKIASLTGSEVGLRFSRAYDWCRNMSAQMGNGFPDLPLPVDAS